MAGKRGSSTTPLSTNSKKAKLSRGQSASKKTTSNKVPKGNNLAI